MRCVIYVVEHDDVFLIRKKSLKRPKGVHLAQLVHRHQILSPNGAHLARRRVSTILLLVLIRILC
jgi:hypothetical protein